MKLFTGLFALATMFVPLAASAADLPAPAVSYYAPVAATPVWAGPYLGVHGGVAWSTLHTALGADAWDNKEAPFIGGGHAGYNFQYGAIVFGPEAELGFLDLGRTVKGAKAGDASSTTSGLYSTAGLRGGFAMGNLLLYGKGGVAVIGGDTSVNGVSVSTSSLGWAAGGGVEYKISPSWSLRGEYQHLNFSDVASGDLLTAKKHYALAQDLDVDTAKAGLTLHFGHGYETLK